MVNRIHMCLIVVVSLDKLSAWRKNQRSQERFNDDRRSTPELPDTAQIQVPLNEAHGESELGSRGNMAGFIQQILQNIGKKKKKTMPETIYEPYWIGGQWVYYRTTPALRKKKPTPAKSTTPWTSSTTTQTRYPQSTTSPTTVYINYMCQHPCPGIYEDFGLVCGQRFNGWKYEMKQFDDACDLINANCINPFTRPEKLLDHYRGPWYLLYRGPCWELTTPWVYPPTNVSALVSRNLHYVSLVEYNKEFSIYPS